MTKSKEEGGLGLQSARGRNIALLNKLNWRFHVEKEALWIAKEEILQPEEIELQ